MKLFQHVLLIVLLAFVYYAGYREWGTDVLIGWLEDMNIQNMISDIWKSVIGWIFD